MFRILKVIDDEGEDAVRVFDILIEMHKLFRQYPPENLSEDLPSLEEFDYIYRYLKMLSDKVIEL